MNPKYPESANMSSDQRECDDELGRVHFDQEQTLTFDTQAGCHEY